MTVRNIEFVFIGKEDTSTLREEWLTEGDWGWGQGQKTTKLLDWDKVIYDIVQTNGHKFSVKYSQISDIIGEEEWVDGEMNTLSNIGSHQIVNLSFGAK